MKEDVELLRHVDGELDSVAISLVRVWCWSYQCDKDDGGNRCAETLGKSKDFLGSKLNLKG